MPVTVAAFYRFAPFESPAALRGPLARLACGTGLKGTILLAPEGINGTIAGPRAGLDAVRSHIRGLPGCADLDWKESTAAEMPFGRLKVRLKREIVTMGQPGLDPRTEAGTHVDPADWNALISAPDVAVIDTRNGYEVAIGTFEGAVNPGTESFGDFPAWWQANGHRFANRRIAMFCTGGIRCEKSTAYLKAQGVGEVYHLRGGILKYLEEVPEEESLWRGDCFVFDDRVAVTHGLREGRHAMCHGCRKPVAPEDIGAPGYERGVSCPACVDRTTEAQKARFRERQRQRDLGLTKGQGLRDSDRR